MADRSGAYLFGEVFKLLAEEPVTNRDRERALKFWVLSRDYDFNEHQMYVDAELIKLGLAKRVKCPSYPDEDRVLYFGRDY